MKKEINIFEIDGVSYWEYKEKITKEFMLDELDFFRKTNRPSYLFINALLQIKELQILVEDLRKTIDRKNERIKKEQNYRVLYWFMFIIWLIVFAVWFWNIDLIK